MDVFEEFGRFEVRLCVCEEQVFCSEPERHDGGKGGRPPGFLCLSGEMIRWRHQPPGKRLEMSYGQVDIVI